MKDGTKNEAISDAERRFFADEPDLDPYDLSMLKPRRRPLRITLALAVMIACSYLIYDSRSELLFFFQSRTPISLGSLDEDSVKAKFYSQEMPSNAYVSLTGYPNPVFFRWDTVGGLGRGPGKNEHTRFLVFPPAEGKEQLESGGIDHIGESTRLSYAPIAVIYYADNSTPRAHLQGAYEGRLIQLKDAPFLGPIRRFVWDKYNVNLPEDAYILLDGEVPSSSIFWVYAIFCFLAAVSVVFNLVVLGKQFMRRGSARG